MNDNPLRLQHRRPAFDRAQGDNVSSTFGFAITRAHERARASGKRQVVTISPYSHPDVPNLGGPWWRLQAWR